MSIAIHKGLTTALRKALQLNGIRVEEKEAAQIMAGGNVFTLISQPGKQSRAMADDIYLHRDTHMREWETSHPGEKPFPDVFAEVVIQKLEAVARGDDAVEDVMVELISLARAELDL